MATKKPESVEAKPAESNNGIGDNAMLTWSVKSDGSEMLVIRHNDPEELLKLRVFFLDVIPKTGKLNIEQREKRAQKQQEVQSDQQLEQLIKQPPKQPINETKGEKPIYMHEGDSCQKCDDGFMAVKSYQKEGQSRQFLSCSNYPACKFTALISKYPIKAKAS